MFINFEEFRQLGQQRVEKVRVLTDATSRGFQAILTELGDYAQKSADNAASFNERVVRVKAPSEFVDLQASSAKSAFEDFTAMFKRVSTAYAELIKEAYQGGVEPATRVEKEPQTVANSAPMSKQAMRVKQG